MKDASRSSRRNWASGFRNRFCANCKSRRKVSRYEAIVCGLAFRWDIRRVVKKACSKAGKSLTSGIQALPSLFQPFSGCSQQFRRARQIPIGVGDVCVPEIGGQDRQTPFGVLAFSVPAQQDLDRETVPKIMQARAATGSERTQSNLPGEDIKSAADLAFVQPVSILVHEEVRSWACTKAAVPAARIIAEDLTGRGMQRYQTGLPKLGISNSEDAFGPVQILGAEVQRFTEPETCDR